VLGALERSGDASDAATALRDTVEALWRIAAQAAREGAFDDASAGSGGRVEFMHRGERILLRIIRRGVAAGTFHPLCTHWVERGLAHALVAGACARWVFGLAEERSLRAGPAADAALEVLRPWTTPQQRGR